MTQDHTKFHGRLNTHAQRLLKTHETLLRDKVRNAAFYKALEKTVRPGDFVLDIGAGTGIWAIAAAKLGAKRVVAIDTDEMMIGMIKILAAEHGVTDRIEAIWGASFDIALAREFDVVVSETIGYLGYDENIVAVMHDARNRFLKEGGMMIPERISLHAAAGQLKVRQNGLPERVPFKFSELANLNLNSPRVLKRSSDIKLLTRHACLIETDLRTAVTRPSLKSLSAHWEVSNIANVNCVILWVESRLTRGVGLSTRRTTSWRPTIFHIEPQDGNFERLEFSLSLTPENSEWTATFVNGDKNVFRGYSLETVANRMIASARANPRVMQQEGHGQSDAEVNCDIKLQSATADDSEFLYTVYAATRADEVAMFGWDATQAQAFLRSQFDIRERSYAMQFPDAARSVIVFEGKNAGNMIVDRNDTGLTLVDIAVLPEFRKKGIASHLLRELQAQAVEENKSIVLHVEKINATAFELYREHEFAATAETDLFYEMTWTPK